MPKWSKDIIVTESTDTYNEAAERGQTQRISLVAYGDEKIRDRVAQALRAIWREAAAEGEAFDYHLCYVALGERETIR